MSQLEVFILITLIIASFVLNVVSVFTNHWCDDIGIVPFYQGEVTWFEVTSWLMFMAFAFFIGQVFVGFFAVYRTYFNGFSRKVRPLFYLICINSCIIYSFETAAFILVAVHDMECSIGSSPIMALVSAGINLIAFFVSFHVAYHHCD